MLSSSLDKRKTSDSFMKVVKSASMKCRSGVVAFSHIWNLHVLQFEASQSTREHRARPEPVGDPAVRVEGHRVVEGGVFNQKSFEIVLPERAEQVEQSGSLGARFASIV